MSLTGLLQRITHRQKKRERNRRSNYHEMVRQIAEGNEPSTDEVDQVLRDTGKSVEKLTADVEVMSRRLGWRVQYEAMADYEVEAADLQAKIAKCDAKLKAAEDENERETGPLYGRLAWIKDRIREGQDAGRSLSETCLNEDLLAELAGLCDRLRIEDTRRSDLEREIAELRRGLESDQDDLPRNTRPSDQERLENRIARSKSLLEKLEPQYAEALKTVAELRDRDKELRRQLLAV